MIRALLSIPSLAFLASLAVQNIQCRVFGTDGVNAVANSLKPTLQNPIKEGLIYSLTPLSRLRGERSEGGEAGLTFLLQQLIRASLNCLLSLAFLASLAVQ